MDINVIEKLIKTIEESKVTEFYYKEGDMEISISTKEDLPPMPVCPPMPYGGAMPQIPMAAPAETEEEFEDVQYITSPIVATFYSAPAPDEPAYVRVGDKVKAGETVCILEAMKLMNEIEAEFDCEIEAIMVSNEQRVEYGQPLFRVKKL